MAVNPIPTDYRRVTPALCVEGAEGLINFIGSVFGTSERLRMPAPDGTIGHAELELGDSVIMVSDATEQIPASTCGLHVYVEDVDATYQKAIAAGAASEMEPADMFYGDRSATFRDTWGNRWNIATHVEDVAEDEMMRRMEALYAQPGS